MRRSRRRWKRENWQGSRRRQFDIKRFLAAVIVISLPVMVFCLAANMVMRTGDIYEYSLDSSGIMDHTTLRTSKSDVVNSFASFMQHRSGELTLIESVDYEPEELFSDQDKAAMAGARTILDIMLVIGVLGLMTSAVCYFLLIRWRVKDIFMKRFKMAALVLLIMEAVNMAVVMIAPLRKAVFGTFLETDFPDGDNMVLLLSKKFPMQVAVFEAILGLIVLLILTYITWSAAGKRKMFKWNR